MKKLLPALCFVNLLSISISTIAVADKVVVIPLGDKKAIGDAVAADVSEGKTFSNKDNIGISGTMPIVGKQIITPGTSTQTINEGYHDGTGFVVGDEDLVPGNVRKGKDIWGVNGSISPPLGCDNGTWSIQNCNMACDYYLYIGGATAVQMSLCLNWCVTTDNAITAGAITYCAGSPL